MVLGSGPNDLQEDEDGNDMGKSEDKIKSFRGRITEELWNDEFKNAVSDTGEVGRGERRTCVPIREYAESIGVGSSGDTLGDNLMVWSKTFQQCVRVANGDGTHVVQEQNDGEAERGIKADGGARDKSSSRQAQRRKKLLVIKTVQLVSEHKKKHIDAFGGVSVVLRAWKMLARWIRNLASWAGKRNPEVCTAIGGTIRNIDEFMDQGDDVAEKLINQMEPVDRGKLYGEVNLAIVSAANGVCFDPKDVLALLGKLGDREKAEDSRRAKDAFLRWIKRSMAGGGGAIQRRANAANALPPLSLVIKKGETNEYVTDPIRVAAHHTEPWKREWEVDNEELWERQKKTMNDMRTTLIKDAGEWASGFELSPTTIRKACATFSSKTGIGFDDLPIWAIAGLPDAALWQLAALFRMTLANLTIPVQCLVNLMCLLGKRKGGSRTVAIMASYYRLLVRVLGHVIVAWDEAAAGPWDSAVKGSSALRAHLARAVGVELDVAEGMHVMHFLWDIQTFYDSIRIEVLLSRMESLGYDCRLLYLGFIAHKAPRILKVGHSMSEVVQNTGRSVIAGCGQIVSWARGLLHHLVEALGYVIPGPMCYEHVDDLSQVVSSLAAAYSRAVRDGVKLGMRVKNGLDNLDLKLSDKSVVVPSSSAVVRAVVEILRGKGVTISAASRAEDVGIEVAAGRRRVSAIQKRRIVKGGRRANGATHIAQTFHGAAVCIGKMGVAPQQSFGHQSMGSAPSNVGKMRSNMKKTTHLGSTRGCTTTTINWIYGTNADPGVDIRLQQIREWMALWSSAGKMIRKRIRRFWSRCMPGVVNDPLKWQKARGPITATICTICEIGWKPAAPDRWFTEDNQLALVGASPYASAHILMHAKTALQRKQVAEARDHADSSGMGDDVGLGPARKVKKHFVKEGRLREAATVDYLVVGALTDPMKGDDGNYRNEDLCNRCGGRVLVVINVFS